jgi:hypothetical protein
MYIETIKDDIKFIVSDKPYFEFEYLQTLAKKNNIKKVIKDFKDEYFVCALLNEEPDMTIGEQVKLRGNLRPEIKIKIQ